MFKMIFENQNGTQLHFGEGYPFTIIEFTGMNPPSATINTNESALVDGAKFNSSKLNMRHVQVAFVIEEDAAKNRLEVYKVLQSKRYLKIYYKSELLDVFLEGYVESCDVSHWAKKNVVTLSVLCPFPYLKVADEVISEFSSASSLFHFAFASPADPPQLVFGEIYDFVGARVENAGNVPCGLIFKLYATGYIGYPKVMDRNTGEFFQINISMIAGDQIIVDTTQGYRKVIRIRDGVEKNIFNNWDPDSTWLQLPVEGSTYVYGVASGSAEDLTVDIEHFDLFEGV
jgi:hypothetical protein